uniref:Uncharacterized protein n=1 Tax=Candidatus Methanophaga sp. ANME-1 ERB7 TaxID=2759913 RepID=A0A7G9ZBC8_9EURY|nr:hypothetical protein KFNHKPCL_00010 [Methanosarcinales archaeon ANME-1 ERB7]
MNDYASSLKELGENRLGSVLCMGYGVKQRVCGSLSYCKNKGIYIVYISI